MSETIALSQEKLNSLEIIESIEPQKWPAQHDANRVKNTDGLNSDVAKPAKDDFYLGKPDSVIAPHRERIIDTIYSNPVTIIRSPTGTGKTTEITQYLVEHAIRNPDQVEQKIYCTQPRIVAAASTSGYIRPQLVGRNLPEDLANEWVGCHTSSIDDYDDARNILTVMTDGIPIQQIINDSLDISNVTIVLDEVHEDKENMQLIMQEAKTKGFRLVLMSATVNVDKKARYFADENGQPAPIIDIEGRTFEIEEKKFSKRAVAPRPASKWKAKTETEATGVNAGLKVFFDKSHDRLQSDSANLAFIKSLAQAAEGAIEYERVYRTFSEAIREYSSQEKDIMLFINDIREVERMKAICRKFVPPSYTILGLSGDQTPDKQELALRDYPGGKLIISTDVGMTSLTPNIDVVLDSGFYRSPYLDNSVDGLTVMDAPQAVLDQRAGRSGRTKNGIHEVVLLPGYPYPTEPSEDNQYAIPEIKTKRPDETLLKLKAMGYNSVDGLIEDARPEITEIERSKDRLRQIGAIAIDACQNVGELGGLTEIGRRMVQFPVDVYSARMIVEAEKYSRAVQLQMAAVTAVRRVRGVHSGNITPRQYISLTRERDNDMLAGLDLLIEAAKMTQDERYAAGISEKKFLSAIDAFESISQRLSSSTEKIDNGDSYLELSAPTDIERAQLHACMISAIDRVYVSNSQGNLSSGREKKLGHGRKLSKNSVIFTRSGDLVAGTPYNVDSFQIQTGHSAERGKKKKRVQRLVTNGIRVDLPSLRELTDRVDDRPTGAIRINPHGLPEEEVAVYFDKYALGIRDWRPVDAGVDTKKFMIDHMFDSNLGDIVDIPDAVKEMRRLYAEVRDLQSRVAQENDDFDEVLERMRELTMQSIQAANDDDILNIQKVEFDLSKHISSDRKQAILESAPDTVPLYDHDGNFVIDAPVRYVDNVAYITLEKNHYPLLGKSIEALGDRKVFVRPKGGHKYMTHEEAISQIGTNRKDLRTNAVSEQESKARQLRNIGHAAIARSAVGTYNQSRSTNSRPGSLTIRNRINPGRR